MSDDVTRVGLILPSSNTVMEVDLYRRLPFDVQLHTVRMFLEETTSEGESLMLDEFVRPAVRDLATAHPHVVLFGCTSAGALRGDAYDQELCGRIGEVAGVEVISTIASVRASIQRRGAHRIGVITPYVDALNSKISASLQSDGVDVAAIHGLGIQENFAIASVPPDEIVAFGATSFEGGDIELLFASCTNFHAIDAIAGLEAALGVPVVTSNQAVLEAVLDMLGRTWSDLLQFESPGGTGR